VGNYLLSPTRPSGRYKAVFFQRFGSSLARTALRSYAADFEVAKVKNSPFGVRYIWRVNSQIPTAAIRWSYPFVLYSMARMRRSW